MRSRQACMKYLLRLAPWKKEVMNSITSFDYIPCNVTKVTIKTVWTCRAARVHRKYNFFNLFFVWNFLHQVVVFISNEVLTVSKNLHIESRILLSEHMTEVIYRCLKNILSTLHPLILSVLNPVNLLFSPPFSDETSKLLRVSITFFFIFDPSFLPTNEISVIKPTYVLCLYLV